MFWPNAGLPERVETGRNPETSVTGRTDESSPRFSRSLFWAVWFVLVPLVLAGVTVWLLKPSGTEAAASGFAKLRWLVQDQPVPSGPFGQSCW